MPAPPRGRKPVEAAAVARSESGPHDSDDFDILIRSASKMDTDADITAATREAGNAAAGAITRLMTASTDAAPSHRAAVLVELERVEKRLHKLLEKVAPEAAADE